MALRSVEEYRAGLRDGRRVFVEGRRVDDVTADPALGVAARHSAIEFDLAHEPALADPARRWKAPPWVDLLHRSYPGVLPHRDASLHARARENVCPVAACVVAAVDDLVEHLVD